MSLEKLILQNLIWNEDYCRKVLPFLTNDYFRGEDKILFNQINEFVTKYNTKPSVDALSVEIESLNNLTEEEAKSCMDNLSSWKTQERDEVDEQWLLDNTEEFCQNKAIYNAMTAAIEIMNDKNGTLQKGAIPKLLSDALAVSFDQNIGHDYFNNIEERHEFYHRVEERVPFDLEFMNKITKGGLPKKTLNIILAGTGVGKSLFMCHCAAANLSQGKNVLYITLEMAEEKIAERIDANLLNMNIIDLEKIPIDIYKTKIEKIRNKTNGKLIVKEYPTASATTGHFRNLLNELRLKKNFVPDIIYVDYLNICASSRMKQGGSINSYTYIKAIAEELRGLAVEFKLPIVSATQTTRSGYSNSDVELTDTSESFGLPATADFMIALISNEDLDKLNQIMVKQLKNRYNDPNFYKKFVIGVDRAKMKLYDAEASAQADISDSGQPDVQQKPVIKNKFKGLTI